MPKDYDEVEDSQRGENVLARVQDPNFFRGPGKTMERWKVHRGETEKELLVEHCFMRSKGDTTRRQEVAKDFDSKSVMSRVALLKRGAGSLLSSRNRDLRLRRLVFQERPGTGVAVC